MDRTLAEFSQLVNAEDYFEFFGLPYDPQFVNVNRLHILQKFAALMKAIDAELPDLAEAEQLKRYQTALHQAYATFMNSSPQDEKLFKVFNEKPKGMVLLSDIGSDTSSD